MDTFKVNYQDSDVVMQISNVMTHLLKASEDRPFIIVCVGTDRSTGDALAPIVGSRIDCNTYGVEVYGTLDEPVDAVNLEATLDEIYKTYGGYPFIVAIDSSLGTYGEIGDIKIEDGPLRAGSGVGRDLKPFGDIVIKGYVNYMQNDPYEALQSTRLSLVIRMGDVISNSIMKALQQLKKYRYKYTNYRR